MAGFLERLAGRADDRLVAIEEPRAGLEHEGIVAIGIDRVAELADQQDRVACRIGQQDGGGIAVVIDLAGQLWTVPSSRR